MAVTITVEGPKTEAEDFCTALETIMLDDNYVYVVRGWQKEPSDHREAHAYLVVKKDQT